jgi:hypothetical protein
MYARLLQGKVTISNDGATIMKLLDVVHPAAKILVDISLSQDTEVGSLSSGLHAICENVCSNRLTTTVAAGW